MNTRRKLMANKLVKNNKQYSVKEFCEKYNGTNVQQTKDAYIQEILKPEYVPYEEKIAICEKIVESSHFRKGKNGNKQLHVNSPIQYVLFCMQLVNKYTKINVDFKNIIEEFNLLNKLDILNNIVFNIPEKESKEFRTILDMVENDMLQNEYEIGSYIRKQTERFGELFENIVTPLMTVIDKLDDKTIIQLLQSIKSVNDLNTNK